MFHVKPPPHAIDVRSLEDALASCEVRVEHAQLDLLARHAALVLEANSRLNLTRIVSPEDVVHLHIVDSLAFLPLVAPLQSPLVDIGSGAGYPGIPLAILGYDVTLLESVGKKAAFLQEAVTDLGLTAPVVRARAEELATTRPEFSTAIARAVSSLPALVELASPLLRTGGQLVALKGTPEELERASASKAADIVGMRHSAEVPYRLPRGEARTVVTYEKVAASRMKLPRRSGMAQRQPLGTDK